MSGWMADMADLVDAAEAAAPAPPLTKAQPPESMRTASIDDTATEPATSPRVTEVPVQRWPEELQLPTGMIGPREEPEKFPTRFIINDGDWTPEEHEEMLHKAAQGWNYRDWNREHQEAELREKEAHERSIQEWQAQVESQGLPRHSCVPCGPPPKDTSSMRVFPDVHAALRQNDPHKAPGSQPVLKTAPPSAGRPRLKAFYSEGEPPRIGSAPVQPPPPPRPSTWDGQPPRGFHSSTPTPVTPGYPPRPPIEALPKPMPMETSQATKHPLPEPAQEGPPNKHVRHKAFPYDQQPPATASMPLPSSVEMPRPGIPSPKGPPASFMPTPEEVQQMSSSSPAVDPEDTFSGRGRYKRVRSSTEIDWTRPLEVQLEPNLKGGPDPSNSFEELRLLRKQIPKLSISTFNQIYPSDNVIRVVQKPHGVHEVKMREVAARVLNATHWFNLLKQPMMIVIWCRDWSEQASFNI